MTGSCGMRRQTRHQLDFAQRRLEVFANCTERNELVDAGAGVAQRVADAEQLGLIGESARDRHSVLGSMRERA